MQLKTIIQPNHIARAPGIRLENVGDKSVLLAAGGDSISIHRSPVAFRINKNGEKLQNGEGI